MLQAFGLDISRLLAQVRAITILILTLICVGIYEVLPEYAIGALGGFN